MRCLLVEAPGALVLVDTRDRNIGRTLKFPADLLHENEGIPPISRNAIAGCTGLPSDVDIVLNSPPHTSTMPGGKHPPPRTIEPFGPRLPGPAHSANRMRSWPHLRLQPPERADPGASSSFARNLATVRAGLLGALAPAGLGGGDTPGGPGDFHTAPATPPITSRSCAAGQGRAAWLPGGCPAPTCDPSPPFPWIMRVTTGAAGDAGGEAAGGSFWAHGPRGRDVLLGLSSMILWCRGGGWTPPPPTATIRAPLSSPHSGREPT